MINTAALQEARAFRLPQADKEAIARHPSCGKKVESFLELNEITVKDIDYQIREEFKVYLSEQNTSKKKQMECLSTLDNIRIEYIEKNIRAADSLSIRKWMNQDRFFLLYYPDVKVAREFKGSRIKEELFWDVSDVNEDLKEQVKRMIPVIIQNKSDLHERNRYLCALRQYMRFCNKRTIFNLEQIEIVDVNQFKLFSQRNNKETRDACFKIVDYCRKWLFLTDEEVNYQCPIWYLERFALVEERVNLASPVRRISFLNIECGEYRETIQRYALYLIGNMYYSISTIRKRIGDIKVFLIYLSKDKIPLGSINDETIARYYRYLQSNNAQNTTIDRHLISIRFFVNYLLHKCIVDNHPIRWKRYIKGKSPVHVERYLSHDICVDRDNCFQYMPEDLGLMYLLNTRTGARISEICTLRANAFTVNGDDAFMRVYQTKMKADHVMTISAVIARMVMRYIVSNGYKSKDYIFLNANGEPYNEQTYRTRLNKIFREYGNHDYMMKSHDYRHMVFTDLYDSGVDLQTIRQIANHDNTRMTSRYIDKSQRRSVRKQKGYYEHECDRNK